MLENIPGRQLRGAARALRTCGAGISRRYPIVEADQRAAVGLRRLAFRFRRRCAQALLFVWAMVALTFIDLDTQQIAARRHHPALLWLGLAFNLGATFAELPDAVIGAMAAIWRCGLCWGFKLATGKEGMGYGDFGCSPRIGAWLAGRCCR